MSNPLFGSKPAEKHLQLWFYFLPIIGVIPSAWTLCRIKDSNLSPDNPLQSSSQPNRNQQRKASRLAVNSTLVWLCSYILLFSGANDTSAIVSFRFLFANAMVTTGYFISCVYFMFRIGKKKLFSTD